MQKRSVKPSNAKTSENKMGTRAKTPKTLAVQRFSAAWRRGGDLNPRYACGVHSISNAAPSAARTPLHMLHVLSKHRR